MQVSSSQFAILGMLTLRPMTGYEIRQTIERSIAHFWSESFGQIYPTLKKLVNDGLATSKEKHGAREKQTYTITAKGRREFEQWLELTPREQPPRSELLLKLFFSGEVPVDTSIAHVEGLRQRQQKTLAVYATLEKQLQREHPRNPNLPYWLMTLSFGRHRSQATLEWCDETLSKLKQMERRKGAAV